MRNGEGKRDRKANTLSKQCTSPVIATQELHQNVHKPLFQADSRMYDMDNGMTWF